MRFLGCRVFDEKCPLMETFEVGAGAVRGVPRDRPDLVEREGRGERNRIDLFTKSARSRKWRAKAAAIPHHHRLGSPRREERA